MSISLQKGEYNLVEYLLNKKLIDIRFLVGNRDSMLTKLRIKGYVEAYRNAGLTFKEEWIIETFPDFEHGFEAAKALLEKSKPDAIITINDFLALGVLKAVKEKRLKVPQDIAIAGYDDLLFSSILETSLTTVRQPLKEICNLTVKKLMIMIGKDNKDLDNVEMIYLEPKLIIRGSTK